MELEHNTTFSNLPVITAMKNIIYVHDYWSKWHSSVTNELIFLMNGSLELTYDNIAHVVYSGEIALLPYPVLHREEFSDKINLEAFFIHFNWKHENEFFSLVNNENIKNLSPDVRFEVNTIINSLRSITNLKGSNRLLAQSRFNLLLTLIYCDIKTVSNSNNQVNSAQKQFLIKQAQFYMEANLAKNITLDDIADYLEVSKFHISRIFKSELNLTLFEYLNDLRMRVALELLHEGRLYISEIALRTGFSNRKYFSKVFKKFYGESPTKYSPQKPASKKNPK
jgi:AraC-like DNA-binding protein